MTDMLGIIYGIRISPRLGSWSQGVYGAADPLAPAIQHMGIDHRRLHVFMPKQLLNGSDVIAVFQKMCGEGMATMPAPA